MAQRPPTKRPAKTAAKAPSEQAPSDGGGFNVVTGLLRSGSTMLCELLNQRPDTYASSTSVLPVAMANLATLLTNSPEETSRLQNIPGTEEHHVRIARTLAEVWHDTDAPVVFDKSRGWSRNALLLRSFMPEAKMVVLVRDPRDVAASIEWQHRRTAIYDGNQTIGDRLEAHLAPNGLIGGPLLGITDLLNRKLDGIVWVKYERLAIDPQGEMDKIEAECGLEPHEYDFVNIEPTATDADWLYRNKFPHTVNGPVEPRERKDWPFTDAIADEILRRFPLYCDRFSYGNS